MLRRLCFALWPIAAWAGEAPLILQGSAPYYGLRVPLAVQMQTRNADLSDLRVLNARGEPMPYAWADEPVSAAQEQVQAVPFFKAPAAASAVDASQQGGWILDTRAVRGALIELQLSVPPATHGIYGFVLESSADLQQWHSVRSAAQLVSLQHQGQRLEHTRFELDGLRTRYLRLRPRPGNPVLPLTGAQVTSVSHYTPEPPMQWSEPLAPTQCTPQHCDYSVPRHLPLERLEWQLAEANTLARVQLWAQAEAGSAPVRVRFRPHRVREHLRELRHKKAPAAEGAWMPLQPTTVYWLRLPEGELKSPPLDADGGLYTQLRIGPAGGMAQLGPKPPTLRIGSHAPSLVFLAREPAPYRLAWGGDVQASALPLAQLMPKRQPGDPMPQETATVQFAPPVVASPPSQAAASAAPEASRKFWLWGVLLVALALMGAMAWSLLRPPLKP
ncbi:MAG TPA: DUF3999 family protein [Albitalea sp.]|nr:DUF3999 family protein [Albitalea sp.]